MKKLILFLLLGILFVNSLSFASALTTREFFFTGFESGPPLTSNWTANAKYSVDTGTVYAGTYSVLANGGTADVLMTTTNGYNVSNQTSCNLTAVMQIHSNLDGGEYLCLDYSIDNGVTWNRNTGSDGVVGDLCQDGNVDIETAWRNVSYSFNPSGINSFKFRFRLNTNNQNEDGYIDNVNLTCSRNNPPTMNNITASHLTIKGGNTITIWANTTINGVNDTENDTLQLFCDNTTTPNSTNTDCTGGTLSDSAYPYIFSCTFATAITSTNYTEYCRVYDGTSYSSVRNITYTTDSSPPTTAVISVAGDTSAPYYDSVNDGRTNISISGESGMLCRWSSSDVVYTSMTNDCAVNGAQANCSVSDASQGFLTRYISCQDSLGNSQNTSQNLDIQFYLDYTAPTTSDNSVATVKAPNYTVTITEADNVDSDPTSYYCTSTSAGCNPVTLIDNGGTITYTSANRGANYLRYYSIDFVGNMQVNVSKTININYLPIFTSASDNAVTIKGGAPVNISTVSNDSDSGQELTLFVCSSAGATFAGCSGAQYCNSTAMVNVSCNFTSEVNSATHNWYAYLFDELGEAAVSNPQTGSYVTDITAPTITLAAPTNGSIITQDSVTIIITSNEPLTNAWYSLNDGENISMANSSLYSYSHSNTSIVDGSYNLSIWANDSVGNMAGFLGRYFIINTAVPDTTPPEITILSPINGSYYISDSVLLNISTDEDLNWSGYKIDAGSLTDLDNVSTTNWNTTLVLTEGQHNITFYANDSSNNQANKSVKIYVDLTNPSVDSFSCTDVNDSFNVICSANVSDVIRLNYIIIGHNATGSWINSSAISVLGNTSASVSYTIGAGNTTPGIFGAEIYLYDYSGRFNGSSSDLITIADDTTPGIFNITYSPSTSDALDPGVLVKVNATIVEDYKILEVLLMWQNLSDGNWISVAMENNSAIANGSSATVVYNASFLPGNGTYKFKINATDVAGNQNVSSITTLIIANESSYWNSTTIPSIKTITYAQRSENNSLGLLYINNTGDTSADFTINITGNQRVRFNVNYTNSSNATYTLGQGENISLEIMVNTTDLTSILSAYNISVITIIGTSVFEKQLNIQTADGPYLQISVDTFSSSVTTSQTGVTYAVLVTNLGTQAASDVSLNWTLPSIFTLASGNLSRSFSNLPVGVSGANTITVNVGSATTNTIYYINASATASNADSVNTSKAITVSNPITVTTTTTSGGGGGGGGGGGISAPTIKYAETIEVVRGSGNSFTIPVQNKYQNTTLNNLKLTISGFPEKYVVIIPALMGPLNYGEIQFFTVTLTAPSYKNYEEYDLEALITGNFMDGLSKKAYSEKQTFKLIIEEVSSDDARGNLSEAEQAIQDMKNSGFNTANLESLYLSANSSLFALRNKEAYDLAVKIINTKNQAFRVYEIINQVMQQIENPKSSSIITGQAISGEESSGSFFGSSFFGGKSAGQVLALAQAAFDRGDYATAEERAKNAQLILILERKGNAILFVYLYWPYIAFAIALLSFLGIVSYRAYSRRNVSERIVDLDRKESNVKNLIIKAQEEYFFKKISSSDYHAKLNEYHKELSEIRTRRINLRNKRISLLKPEEVAKNLDSEKGQVEKEVIKAQEDYYRDKKMSEGAYKQDFEILNERLAEIEDERITINLVKSNEEKLNKTSRAEGLKNFVSSVIGFFNKLKKNFSSRKEKNLKAKIDNILKQKKGEQIFL